jgi:hypothetical protein
VHYLRDGHELKEKYPHDEQLHRWAASVKAIYEQAVAWAEQGPDPRLSPRQQQQTRVAQQHAFEQQLLAVCRPYVGTTTPQHTLCERVERFLPELFVFVAVPGVPAHNELVAYCTPSAWLACVLIFVSILLRSMVPWWREERNSMTVGSMHRNQACSSPVHNGLSAHSIGFGGLVGG